jgi:hypothetical protein
LSRPSRLGGRSLTRLYSSVLPPSGSGFELRAHGAGCVWWFVSRALVFSGNIFSFVMFVAFAVTRDVVKFLTDCLSFSVRSSGGVKITLLYIFFVALDSILPCAGVRAYRRRRRFTERSSSSVAAESITSLFARDRRPRLGLRFSRPFDDVAGGVHLLFDSIDKKN